MADRSEYLHVTKAMMDAVFRAEKGWTCYDNQGREFVYEYPVPGTIIRMRVASSIYVRTGASHPSGETHIRIWAIGYEIAPKNVFGLCRRIAICRSSGWENRIQKAYRMVLARARQNLAVVYH